MVVNRVRERGASCVIDKTGMDNIFGNDQLHTLYTIKLANSIGTLSAIFNLAMIISDALFRNQSADTFDYVCKPKVSVTHNLDAVTRRQCHSLDYFVVFSSIVSGRGNAGQTNYGFANSAMERICEKRRTDGLHGLAIQWGAIGDVGIIAETMGANDVVIADTIPQRMHSCLQLLDQMLMSSDSVVCSHVMAHRNRQTDGSNKLDLVTQICNALGIRDKTKVKPSTTLAEMGMDSLMATVIKQILDKECSISFKINDIANITFNDLTSQKIIKI